MRFDNRLVVITGAAAGIGRCAVSEFCAAGARVVAVDIDEAGVEDVAASVRSAGGDVQARSCDITDADAVNALAAEIRTQWGGADVLYNNAGGSVLQDSPVHLLDEAALDRTFDVDIRGTINMSRSILPDMMERGAGAIVNTASCVSILGFPGRDAYTAAKGAVSSLTRSMAAEYAPHGIRVNAVAPGITLTSRIRARMHEHSAVSARERRHLLGPCEPEDVVGAAMFLASDRARRITAVILPVDSGLTSTAE